MVILYHYTTEDGVQRILDSGKIHISRRVRTQSHQTGALSGDGVYFTSLPPSTNKEIIVNTNWFDGQSKIEREFMHKTYKHRVEFYFKFDSADLPQTKKTNKNDFEYLCAKEIDLDKLLEKGGDFYVGTTSAKGHDEVQPYDDDDY